MVLLLEIAGKEKVLIVVLIPNLRVLVLHLEHSSEELSPIILQNPEVQFFGASCLHVKISRYW